LLYTDIRLTFVLNLKAIKMSKVTGYVIYEGKSEINGKNIVAVITLNSSNIKLVIWLVCGF
jgi:hypothetical protein